MFDQGLLQNGTQVIRGPCLSSLLLHWYTITKYGNMIKGAGRHSDTFHQTVAINSSWEWNLLQKYDQRGRPPQRHVSHQSHLGGGACTLGGQSWQPASVRTEWYQNRAPYCWSNINDILKAGLMSWSSQSWQPGPRFNIKMSYQYRKSHCGDKTVVRSSYLYNGFSYTGKMSSLYWIGALPVSGRLPSCHWLCKFPTHHWTFTRVSSTKGTDVSYNFDDWVCNDG